VYDALKPTKENDCMTLIEFFEDKPRGAKIAMARKLNVSKTWMSLIISGRELASPELSGAIERYTKGQVKRTTLRPDIFGDLK
jgi:DNA-binding transcriptional regulator YdaS (Cro superfamily)